MKEENDNAGKNAEEKAASGKKNNENALITKESIGAVGALFSALAFLILATRSFLFGDVGIRSCSACSGTERIFSCR